MTNDKNLQNDNATVSLDLLDGALKAFSKHKDDDAYIRVLMAFKEAMDKDRRFFVGLESIMTDEERNALAERITKGELKPGDEMVNATPIRIAQLPSGEEGKYIIPLFTSSEESGGFDVCNMCIQDVIAQITEDANFFGFGINVQSSGVLIGKDILEKLQTCESEETSKCESEVQEKLKFNRTYLNMVHRALVNMRNFPEQVPYSFLDNAIRQLIYFDSYVLVDEITYNLFLAPKTKSLDFLLNVMACTEEELPVKLADFTQKYKAACSLGNENSFWIPIFTQEEENKGSLFPRVEKVKISKIISIISKTSDCLGVVFNSYTDTVTFSREGIYANMDNPTHEFKLTILPVGVLDIQAEAIVNSANEDFSSDGGGLNEALFKAAGKNMIIQTRKENCCKVGEAKVTGSCYLNNCTYVVHTVPPKWTGAKDDVINMVNSYLNSFKALASMPCAIQYNNSIAFPLLGAGKGGWPSEKSADCLIKAMSMWEQLNGMPFGIYLCCYTQQEYDTVMKYMHCEKNEKE